MGFPDDFKITVSDTQAYRQFGNSVAVPVVTAIAAHRPGSAGIEAEQTNGMRRSSHSGENEGGSRGRHSRPILSAADKRRLAILRRALLQFFEEHHRSFPWRRTKNWFHLLMAEMMLRRTRADQVLPVYKEFTDRYRTAADALADGATVREMLRPLGLGWRNEAIFDTLAYLRDNMAVRRLPPKQI